MPMIAFDQPWQIVGVIALACVVRVAVPRIPGLRKTRAMLLEFDDSLLLALLLVFCIIRPFVLQSFYIPSGSMEPTLRQGDRILVLKFWYHLHPPRPRDITVFRATKGVYFGNPTLNPDVTQQKDLIKRLQGVPGDRLHVGQAALYRNGERQNEPYLQSAPEYSWPLDPLEELQQRPLGTLDLPMDRAWGENPEQYRPAEVLVPPGCLVMMGDNRNNSNDSTHWRLPTQSHLMVPAPFVPEEFVLGRAWAIFWPLNRVRILH